MLAAGVVDGTAGGDGSGMFASRPDPRRLKGLPRSWRDAVLDQQIAAATRVTDNCDPPVGQKHLALVPRDPFGRRVRVRDPGILGVLAHGSSSPRSIALDTPTPMGGGSTPTAPRRYPSRSTPGG